MDKKRLVETLKLLHADLSQADRVDSEELELLQTLTHDIERVLHERQAAATGVTAPETSRLRGLLLKFESEHPELAAAIGKVADGLAAMGI